jgi:hypothetical protein
MAHHHHTSGSSLTSQAGAQAQALAATHELGQTPRGFKLERLTTWLSVACAVHCIVMPLLSGLLPALGATQVLEAGSGLETVLTVLVVVSVGAGGVVGFLRHRDLRVVWGLGAGLAIYLVGHILEQSPIGFAAAILGAAVLAGASIMSARLSQTCDHAH